MLDIGCSGGALLAALADARFSNLAGIDLSRDAIARCQSRGLQNTSVMNAEAPTFPDASFDLLIASDILEHLEHPQPALENWRRLLKPRGTLLVMVPAFMWLWSQHDQVNHHFRRYTRAGLVSDLRIADWTVLDSGYWNTALFPAVAGVRLARRAIGEKSTTGGDQLRATSPTINRLLLRLLNTENALLVAGVRLPFGVSTWAVAEFQK
jgi:SAM-dependent methyltransferase